MTTLRTHLIQPVPGIDNHLQSLQGTARLPNWWRGEASEYEALFALRARIGAAEAVPLHWGRWGMIGVIVGLLGIANAAVAHAMGDVAGLGVQWKPIAFVFVLVVFVSLWGCDASLARRERSLDLYAALWSKLVAAVRSGQVDANPTSWAAGETQTEQALRKEILVASCYVAAKGTLRPRLKLFSSDLFGLTRADTDRADAQPL